MKRLQQILVNEGYDLGKYGPNRDGVDGAPHFKNGQIISPIIIDVR